MRTRRFLITLLALASLAATVVPAHAAPADAAPIADARFGVAEGFRNAQTMADLGTIGRASVGTKNKPIS